jgi:hypothetical protein
MSELYEQPDGTIAVQLCTERGWYRWALLGDQPEGIAVPVYLVWTE